MEWADIVDLLTAKIPDQKGETKRDDIEADKLVEIELGGYCE